MFRMRSCICLNCSLPRSISPVKKASSDYFPREHNIHNLEWALPRTCAFDKRASKQNGFSQPSTIAMAFTGPKAGLELPALSQLTAKNYVDVSQSRSHQRPRQSLIHCVILTTYNSSRYLHQVRSYITTIIINSSCTTSMTIRSPRLSFPFSLFRISVGLKNE